MVGGPGRYTFPVYLSSLLQSISTAAVTFDNHSLFLDGKQLFMFSGEVHPWRVLTPGWRDILQKMKVAKIY
jgi:Glycosyl hydrolases family 35